MVAGQTVVQTWGSITLLLINPYEADKVHEVRTLMEHAWGRIRGNGTGALAQRSASYRRIAVYKCQNPDPVSQNVMFVGPATTKSKSTDRSYIYYSVRRAPMGGVVKDDFFERHGRQ
jgi:hypothetical protein